MCSRTIRLDKIPPTSLQPDFIPNTNTNTYKYEYKYIQKCVRGRLDWIRFLPPQPTLISRYQKDNCQKYTVIRKLSVFLLEISPQTNQLDTFALLSALICSQLKFKKTSTRLFTFNLFQSASTNFNHFHSLSSIFKRSLFPDDKMDLI